MFKGNDEDTERRHWRRWRRSSILIFNFKHISHHFLVFLIVDYEQVNVCWEGLQIPWFTNTGKYETEKIRYHTCLR